MKIIQSSSPNFSESTVRKTVVVLHRTIGSMPGTLEWMRNPASQVSAHFLITKTGEIHQMVDIKDVAWHAGRVYNESGRARNVMQKNSWGSYVNPNKYCVGIEFESITASDKMTDAQLASSVWLLQHIKDEEDNDFDGSPENIITHRDLTSYKPYMEGWRTAILNELSVSAVHTNSNECVLDNWGQLGIKQVGGKIVIFKK